MGLVAALALAACGKDGLRQVVTVGDKEMELNKATVEMTPIPGGNSVLRLAATTPSGGAFDIKFVTGARSFAELAEIKVNAGVPGTARKADADATFIHGGRHYQGQAVVGNFRMLRPGTVTVTLDGTWVETPEADDGQPGTPVNVAGKFTMATKPGDH